MTRSTNSLLAAMVISAQSAIAQTADRPDVRVGDEWTFAVYYTVPSTTPNRSWLVTSVTAGGIDGTENGEPLRLTRELNVVESPRDKSSNFKLLAFPLEVGKRWHYTNDWLFKMNASKARSIADVAVIGYEKIVVPAGEFEAFKLNSRERLSGTSPAGSRYAGEITRTYWYAPRARAIVRSVSHDPYLGTTTVELVSFELRRDFASFHAEGASSMPNVTIEVRKRYTRQQEEGIIDAVHAALMEGIKTPEWDRTLRLIVHEPHRFATPPGKDERYTLVEIDLFTGRSLEAKKRLYRAIVANLAKFDIPADQIKVLLRESGADNWGIRGGVPASQVDLGFKVDV